jgi:ribosomal protein S18 acetylase RimI-like enzyme
MSSGTQAPGLNRWRREPPVWIMGPLLIRRYRTADAEIVFRLHQECLAQVGLQPGDGVYYDHDFDRLEEIYLADRGEFLVGEMAGTVVAMGALRRIDAELAEMVRVRVSPDHQGLGFGAAVVTALEERAPELGYLTLRCDTTEKQPVAIALYRSFGWRELERRNVAGVQTIYFEKSLRDYAHKVLDK